MYVNQASCQCVKNYIWHVAFIISVSEKIINTASTSCNQWFNFGVYLVMPSSQKDTLTNSSQNKYSMQFNRE